MLDRRSEVEFLPEALEILETPPSPMARVIAAAISGFLALTILWACFSSVDMVAVAEGRMVLSDRSKTIQPFDTGVVRRILVENGATVRAGDLLIELDTTASGAERSRIAARLVTARLDVLRLKALLGRSNVVLTPADGNALGATPEEVSRAQELARNEAREQQERLAGLDRELDRQRAEVEAVEAGIAKLDQSLPLLQERLKARETLLEKGLTPRYQVLELRQQVVAMKRDRDGLSAQRVAAAAASSAAARRREQTVAEIQRKLLSDLTAAQATVADLTQELTKAEQRQELQYITTPVDGVVQQLAVHTLGGVVQPAQALMVIVPRDDHVEIEAQVLNRDIGFVREGQAATVKLEAFSFTRYGTIPGVVASVSRDAINDERQGLVFSARVRVSRSNIRVDGRDVALTAGMRATVEIKTGERRVIGFLLSPILKAVSEAGRER
ncbi:MULTISPECIES: HlyD family type I secretion periplasmic adaptor subunit [unclassified Chelatococcus]|uniref:HlyD family type I secretion periplasmic adaptor subunit n=1 Tax=unclassified Chelatococcus TaxID=2638111 RepID=UPI001BCA75F6|nr:MULTISPECIES: HlyD family type I secretion periplasmic adaptor subunit [unclassified Chelatococcus]MBS7699274.1 HlyD family type I secretion periplasmic adaptor subunit [Chelatococcus sp. YT9]MBX3557594.1 HlyD family type I secretion periplasmic adaptor subunit [Chelatococcus sp.]